MAEILTGSEAESEALKSRLLGKLFHLVEWHRINSFLTPEERVNPTTITQAREDEIEANVISDMNSYQKERYENVLWEKQHVGELKEQEMVNSYKITSAGFMPVFGAGSVFQWEHVGGKNMIRNKRTNELATFGATVDYATQSVTFVISVKTPVITRFDPGDLREFVDGQWVDYSNLHARSGQYTELHGVDEKVLSRMEIPLRQEDYAHKFNHMQGGVRFIKIDNGSAKITAPAMFVTRSGIADCWAVWDDITKKWMPGISAYTLVPLGQQTYESTMLSYEARKAAELQEIDFQDQQYISNIPEVGGAPVINGVNLKENDEIPIREAQEKMAETNKRYIRLVEALAGSLADMLNKLQAARVEVENPALTLDSIQYAVKQCKDGKQHASSVIYELRSNLQKFMEDFARNSSLRSFIRELKMNDILKALNRYDITDQRALVDLWDEKLAEVVSTLEKIYVLEKPQPRESPVIIALKKYMNGSTQQIFEGLRSLNIEERAIAHAYAAIVNLQTFEAIQQMKGELSKSEQMLKNALQITTDQGMTEDIQHEISKLLRLLDIYKLSCEDSVIYTYVSSFSPDEWNVYLNNLLEFYGQKNILQIGSDSSLKQAAINYSYDLL